MKRYKRRETQLHQTKNYFFFFSITRDLSFFTAPPAFGIFPDKTGAEINLMFLCWCFSLTFWRKRLGEF